VKVFIIATKIKLVKFNQRKCFHKLEKEVIKMNLFTTFLSHSFFEYCYFKKLL